MTSAGQAYVELLLPGFRELDSKLHPWWWPMGGGRSLEDWGLFAKDLEKAGYDPQGVFSSLRIGPVPGYVPDLAYSSFLGGVGAHADEGGFVWVLSSRPSNSSFPNRGNSTSKLYNVLLQAGLMARAHVTDFIKFRGPGPDSLAGKGLDIKLRDGRTLEEISFDCLVREWQLLPPCVILVAGGKVQSWVSRRLHVLSSKSDLSEGERRFLNDFRDKLRPVTSWMAYVDQSRIVAEWKLTVQQKCQ